MGFKASPVGKTVKPFVLELHAAGKKGGLAVHSATVVYSIVRSLSLLPHAEVVVVSGKSADGKSINALGAMSSVKFGDKVTLVFSGGESESKTIFEGHVAGIAPYRTDSAYGVTISITHWLAGLTGCSAFFAGLDAQFPEDAMRWMTMPAGAGITGLCGLSVKGLTGLVPFDSNIWEMFKGTLEKAAQITASVSVNNLGKAIAANTGGMAILNRIKGVANMITGVQVTDIMRTTFAMQAMSANSGGATLMEKVLAFCHTMGVMLLPGATSAVIAPEGSLASCKPGLQILGDEETLARVVMNRSSPIDGCYMYGSAEGTRTGIFGSFKERPVASYSVENANGGRIISTEAPPWLRGFLQTPAPTFASTGNGRGGSGGTKSDSKAQDARESAAETIAAMGDRWCRLQWAIASCAGSLAYIEGPLRFDVGPGTQIEVFAGAPEGGGTKGCLRGMVEGVQHRLHAGAAAVSTAVAISGARVSTADNGLKSHPLYGDYLAKWEI